MITAKNLATLATIFLSGVIQFTMAQSMEHSESDLNGVRGTIDNYFIGTTNGDLDALKEAFHQDCRIYSIPESGELTYLDQPSFHSVVLANYKKDKRKNQILFLDITGNTAFAKTRADYSQFAFLDYLTLLKIDGKWKIVSKSTFNLAK